MAILPPPPKATGKRDRTSKKGKPSMPRFLITVNVLGSAGPIRVVVTEGEAFAAIIATVLRSYTREGRLPTLGSGARPAVADFLLYTAGSDAVSPGATISSKGSRSFVLCRRDNLMPSKPPTTMEKKPHSRGGGVSWKSWINKSLSFKTSPH